MSDRENMEVDIDFEKEEQEVRDSEQEVFAGEFESQLYVKTPDVGETITFTVEKVIRNANTTAKNKETGKEFTVGVTDKNKVTKRYDVYTDQGVYTVKNWEVYFKLFGSDGILTQWAKTHGGKFSGAKISIKRLLNGQYCNWNVSDIAKVMNCSEDEARKQKEEISKAIKESRLYEVKLENE